MRDNLVGSSAFGWRATLVLAALFVGLSAPTGARAEEMAVPVTLQATLLVKVAGYDRSMAARAPDRVLVLIVQKPGVADSALVASQLERALMQELRIAGRPRATEQVVYSSAPDLAKRCRDRGAAIVYLTPGFAESEVREIGERLGELSVLSVGALTSYVARGLVLGVDLVSGKPKLVVNLPQARKQRVDFDANLLRLTRVIQ